MKSIILIHSTNSNVRLHWEKSLSDNHYAKDLMDDMNRHYDEVILFHLQNNNLDELKELTENNNKIMVFSGAPTFDEGYPLLSLGIKAYANSLLSSETLQDAVKVVEHGDAWLYPEFINQMILKVSGIPTHDNNEDTLAKLSERESQIALYIAQGLSNKVIAQNAQITERTVKAHLSSIFQKLQIKDRLALALLVNK